MRLRPAIKIAIIYLVCATLWIYLSDELSMLIFHFEDSRQQMIFSIFKGIFYVIVTSWLLYKLILNFYEKIEERIFELQDKQQELYELQYITKTGLWDYNVEDDTITWSLITKEIFDVDWNFEPVPDSILNYIKRESYRNVARQFVDDNAANGRPFDFEMEIITAKNNEKWIRVVGKPFMRNGKCVRLFGSFQDISESKKAEARLLQLNRLYDFMFQTNEMIVHTDDVYTLFSEICRIAVKVGQFRLAWIGQLDENTNIIEPVVHAGEDSGYLTKIKIINDQNLDEGRGPTATAIREAKHLVCNDIENDPLLVPWRNEALKRGFRSSIALPIIRFGKVVNTFTLYSTIVNYFDEKEIELLKEAAGEISYAVENIEKERLRKEAEMKALEMLDRYDTVSKATRDTIWDWDLKNGSMVFNQGINEIFGYEESEIEQTLMWSGKNIHPNDLVKVQKLFDDAFIKKEQIIQSEFRYRCSNDSYKYIVQRVYVKYDNDKPVRAIGAMQDVTSEHEREILIERAVIDTQEKERQQVGMELHDNISQLLSASIIYISLLKKHIAKGQDTSDDFSKIDHFVKEAIDEIRRLSHRLAPVSINEIPLKEVFEKLISIVNANNNLKIGLVVDTHECDLTKGDIKITLYRILQEQINNIIKHSKATEVNISLSVKEHYLVFNIKDNGQGFDPKMPNSGIGLENIRRRAKLLSGELTLNTAPEKGCELIIEIPLENVQGSL